MALLNLIPLADLAGGATAPAEAVFSAQARQAGTAGIRTSGATGTAPTLVRSRYDTTAWDVAPALTVLPAGWYWWTRLEVNGAALERTVVLPTGAGASIDFAALVDVDPRTLAPAPSALAVWLAAVDQKIAAQAAADAATYATKPVALSQAAYDALPVKSASTLYLITD